MYKLPSLKLTGRPLKMVVETNRKRAYSNHPFSENMLVSGRVSVCFRANLDFVIFVMVIAIMVKLPFSRGASKLIHMLLVICIKYDALKNGNFKSPDDKYLPVKVPESESSQNVQIHAKKVSGVFVL